MACNRLLTFFLVCHFLKRFLSKTIHMSPPGSPHGRHDGSFLSWLASDKSIKGCRYMQGAKNACIVPSVAIYIKNQWPIEIIWVHKLPQIWICFYPRPRLRILYQLPAFIWPTRHFLESIVFWIGLPKRPHSSSILYEDPYLISSYVFPVAPRAPPVTWSGIWLRIDISVSGYLPNWECVTCYEYSPQLIYYICKHYVTWYC